VTDASLRAFVAAADEEAAEACLARLIEEEAAPLARRIIARKLRAYGAFPREGSAGEDVEDITSEVLLALVPRLRALREEESAPPIDNLADYTATVAYNAFAHYLRRRHPARSRLKNRLRYVLTHDRRLALWPSAEGLVCGLAGAARAAASPQSSATLERIVTEPDRWLRWTRGASAEADPALLVHPVLQALGEPVDFDRLVGAIATLSPEVADSARADSAHLDAVADETLVPADVALDRRRFTERLWTEVRALPLRQRFALLLNLRDGSGAGMLWVLPITGVATIREIAAVLEMPALEMAGLWTRLPLDDLGIAALLGCTRQQVINLRSAARKRLAGRLAERAGTRERGGAANTPPVSASMADET
jgi:DNA-directed RNA polymerase specialized sigma24 family protein